MLNRTMRTSAGRICWSMVEPETLSEVKGGDDDVDRLDADEGQDEAAQAIDEKIAPEQGRRADRPVSDALQRQGNEGDDDQSVEDHRGQDRGLRRRKAHDVERSEDRIGRRE